jgi:AraC-like DNA-binding protein
MSQRTDRLSGLLQRFELRARVFHSGTLCGSALFPHDAGAGHLHLVRRGPVGFTNGRGQRIEVQEPSAVFYARPLAHQVDAGAHDGVELLCAAIEFGAGDENPLSRGLPDMLIVPLDQLPGLESALALLFGEASQQRCGHNAVVDRLTEVLVVQLLRFAIERRMVDAGLLAGLSDARLSRALTAMHEAPGQAWTLERLAEVSDMSRSRFAARFAEVVGVPAMGYLTHWRVAVAKGLLRRGLPVKRVAVEVGYGRSSTFGRAFSQVAGMAPSAWLRALEVPRKAN